MVLTSRRVCQAAAVGLAFAAAGCAYDGGGGGGVGIATRSSGQVPISQAFMVPPPGGPAVVAVLEERYRNGLAQDIILENNASSAGQNVLYVRAYGPMGRDAGERTLPTDIPSLTKIRTELRERFPGVWMDVSGLYAQNRYGPIGYATGRSHTGSNCLYMWQRIAAEPRLFKFDNGAITWRLRLCDPHTSHRDLLLTAYGFTVSGYFKSRTWNPYGPPPEPDPRIGRRGEVILPGQVVDPTVVAPVSFGQSATKKTKRTTRRRTSSSATVRRAATAPSQGPTVLNAPTPGAAVIPRPQNTDLNEPAINRSNLPQTAPRAGGVAVPGPRTGAVPPQPQAPAVPQTRTVPTAPTVPSPNAGPTVILPRDSSLQTPPPAVRVVELE